MLAEVFLTFWYAQYTDFTAQNSHFLILQFRAKLAIGPLFCEVNPFCASMFGQASYNGQVKTRSFVQQASEMKSYPLQSAPKWARNLLALTLPAHSVSSGMADNGRGQEVTFFPAP